MDPIIARSARRIAGVLLAAGLAVACPAHAGHGRYRYTTIDYPGALCTQAWGINRAGDIVGTAAFAVDCSGTAFAFLYHTTTRMITVLPTVPGTVTTLGIGLGQSGVVVGSAGNGSTLNDVGFILDRGAFRMFSFPGAVHTQGRAIGKTGLVTGFAVDGASNDIPFLYDPATNQFTAITLPGLRPSPYFSVAQGIDSRGNVVGSFNLDPDSVFPGSLGGPYGFLRNPSGGFTLFRVNGYRTRARGISDTGQIVGFLADDATGTDRGFVVRLNATGGFQSLTVPDAALLDVPGAVATDVQDINDVGQISGSWTDAAGVSHGFVATPVDP